ncbi:MAG: hypothetical protein IRZ10_10920 [Thermoflavifilum sp.]|nr:hypothetical protein [Thermoflavifilum sp.]MCL6514919.1 hypothetical protein [Alicyclobacillus sp.]
MRAWQRRVRRAAVEWLAIPEDSMLETSRLTCVGGEQTVIENVRGLIHVSDSSVVLDLPDCRLHLTGAAFEVTFMAGNEVHVQGRVHTVRYEWRKEGAR